ncbi:MFS transporter [Feifania hominis]|uniref:MFS transporter n=1 Tax=Feifania hominis TaxID=2763660 RepID=A0A926DDK1_9FIRM|nr:MFS transporter [Feifania hominis]MBC8536995.1 MFS transporter [Feifania hominis]
MRQSDRFDHTLRASYLGYVTQAIVNNFAPLLFLSFQSEYAIALGQITLLVSVNFGVQLLVDLLASRCADRIGYRPLIVAAHLFAAAGLAGLGILPELFGAPFAGLLTAVCLTSVGGGLIEVLISPIVEACPMAQKSSAMSLLHSFYCWGQVFVVLASTLFFAAAGIENWRLLALLWALLPLGNALYFSRVPLRSLEEHGGGLSLRALLSGRLFWIFALLMVCAGAAEQAMSQWASAFAEAGLGVSKAAGDLAGPCLFAALMGTARLLHAKFGRPGGEARVMALSAVGSACGFLLAAAAPLPALSLLGCALCGLSAGVLWPGTFSLAARECAGGTAMFALLALAGDLGCAAGPAVVGTVADHFGGSLRAGLGAAVLFAVLLLVGLAARKHTEPVTQENSGTI